MIKAIKDILLFSVFGVLVLHAFIPHTHTPISFQEEQLSSKKEPSKSVIGLFKLMFQDKSEDSLDNLAFSHQKVSQKVFFLKISIALEYHLLPQTEAPNHISLRQAVFDERGNDRLIFHSNKTRGPPLS